MPSSISASRACSAAPTVPESPPERWIDSTSSPASSSGSPDVQEVAHRRLRRARQRGRRAHVVVEGVVVAEVALAVGPAVPVHVQRDEVDPVAIDDLRGEVLGRIGDDCDAGHGGQPILAPWLGSSSPARPASSARISYARCSRAATTCASRCGRTSPTNALEGLDVEHVTADITDPRAMRRAAKGIERAFHVAGTVNLRKPAEESLRINAEGTRTVLDACLAAGVERAVHVSSVAAIGPARPGGALDERHVWSGPLGIPYPDAKHAAEVEALRVAARGLDVVVASPAHVLGRGDERRSSTEVVRRFLLRRIPAYVDGGDLHRRRRGRRRRPAAVRREGRDRRALHPRHPQLHVEAPVRRARAAVGRRGPGGAAAQARRARACRGGDSGRRARR